MSKRKHLSKRQLNVIEDLFVGEITEQDVLDKYKVGRHLYSKWLTNERFAEQLDKRITSAYRQSTAYIARCATLAAVRLVQLTASDKPETARKACLDIISMNAAGTNSGIYAASPDHDAASAENEPQQLSAETAGRLLAVLAEENIPQ